MADSVDQVKQTSPSSSVTQPVQDHALPDCIIASSNRFNDLRPYCDHIWRVDPQIWSNVMPWEFPQVGTKESEEAFLRKFFDETEIHMQGGAHGEGLGFKFLKQAWWSIALYNAETRAPALAREWWEQDDHISWRKDPTMLDAIRSPDAKPETFFDPVVLKRHGPKILKFAVKHIQHQLRVMEFEENQDATRSRTISGNAESDVSPSSKLTTDAKVKPEGASIVSAPTAMKATSVASEEMNAVDTTQYARKRPMSTERAATAASGTRVTSMDFVPGHNPPQLDVHRDSHKFRQVSNGYSERKNNRTQHDSIQQHQQPSFNSAKGYFQPQQPNLHDGARGGHMSNAYHQFLVQPVFDGQNMPPAIQVRRGGGPANVHSNRSPPDHVMHPQMNPGAFAGPQFTGLPAANVLMQAQVVNQVFALTPQDARFYQDDLYTQAYLSNNRQLSSGDTCIPSQFDNHSGMRVRRESHGSRGGSQRGSMRGGRGRGRGSGSGSGSGDRRASFEKIPTPARRQVSTQHNDDHSHDRRRRDSRPSATYPDYWRNGGEMFAPGLTGVPGNVGGNRVPLQSMQPTLPIQRYHIDRDRIQGQGMFDSSAQQYHQHASTNVGFPLDNDMNMSAVSPRTQDLDLLQKGMLCGINAVAPTFQITEDSIGSACHHVRDLIILNVPATFSDNELARLIRSICGVNVGRLNRDPKSQKPASHIFLNVATHIDACLILEKASKLILRDQLLSVKVIRRYWDPKDPSFRDAQPDMYQSGSLDAYYRHSGAVRLTPGPLQPKNRSNPIEDGSAVSFPLDGSPEWHQESSQWTPALPRPGGLDHSFAPPESQVREPELVAWEAEAAALAHTPSFKSYPDNSAFSRFNSENTTPAPSSTNTPKKRPKNSKASKQQKARDLDAAGELMDIIPSPVAQPSSSSQVASQATKSANGSKNFEKRHGSQPNAVEKLVDANSSPSFQSSSVSDLGAQVKEVANGGNKIQKKGRQTDANGEISRAGPSQAVQLSSFAVVSPQVTAGVADIKDPVIMNSAGEPAVEASEPTGNESSTKAVVNLPHQAPGHLKDDNAADDKLPSHAPSNSTQTLQASLPAPVLETARAKTDNIQDLAPTSAQVTPSKDHNSNATEVANVDDSFHTAQDSPSAQSQQKNAESIATPDDSPAQGRGKFVEPPPKTVLAAANSASQAQASTTDEMLRSSPSDVGKDALKTIPDVLKPAVADSDVSKPKSINLDPIAEGTTSVPPTPAFATAPSTPALPITNFTPVEMEKSSETSAPKEKEKEKPKGPSQTESLSMFGKKAKLPKKAKPVKGKGSIRGKPTELAISAGLADRDGDAEISRASTPTLNGDDEMMLKVMTKASDSKGSRKKNKQAESGKASSLKKQKVTSPSAPSSPREQNTFTNFIGGLFSSKKTSVAQFETPAEIPGESRLLNEVPGSHSTVEVAYATEDKGIVVGDEPAHVLVSSQVLRTPRVQAEDANPTSSSEKSPGEDIFTPPSSTKGTIGLGVSMNSEPTQDRMAVADDEEVADAPPSSSKKSKKKKKKSSSKDKSKQPSVEPDSTNEPDLIDLNAGMVMFTGDGSSIVSNESASTTTRKSLGEKGRDALAAKSDHLVKPGLPRNYGKNKHINRTVSSSSEEGERVREPSSVKRLGAEEVLKTQRQVLVMMGKDPVIVQEQQEMHELWRSGEADHDELDRVEQKMAERGPEWAEKWLRKKFAAGTQGFVRESEAGGGEGDEKFVGVE